MTEKGKSITAWISVSLLLFGMVSGAIAFTVTTNNKANNNEKRIEKHEDRIANNECRINAHDVKIDDIDEMKKDIKELKKQNTEILVILGRMEEKIEVEK